VQTIQRNGGDDGTRTRGLCRDSLAPFRFYNDLTDREACQSLRKSYKTSHFVGWIVVENLTPRGPPCPTFASFTSSGNAQFETGRASNFPGSEIYSFD